MYSFCVFERTLISWLAIPTLFPKHFLASMEETYCLHETLRMEKFMSESKWPCHVTINVRDIWRGVRGWIPATLVPLSKNYEPRRRDQKRLEWILNTLAMEQIEDDIATPPSEQKCACFLFFFFLFHNEDVPSEGWSGFSHSIFQMHSHHWWSIRLDGQEFEHKPVFSLRGSSRW